MADTWIEAVRDHLAANGIGVVGVSLFIGGLDDGAGTDDAALGIGEYGGGDGIQTASPGTAIRRPSLQIASRALDYLAARTMVDDGRALLELVTNATIEGFPFIRIEPSGDINYLQRDANGRHRFTHNFDVEY